VDRWTIKNKEFVFKIKMMMRKAGLSYEGKAKKKAKWKCT
jgi:hypothetical protein